MKILIVEDNDDMRVVLSSYLEEELFAVDAVSDGTRGSYLARTNEYDLVILDCMLPDKDGSEVCKEIRRHGSDVPILIISALSGVTHKIGMFENGADDYVTKPFSLQEIRARVAALLRRPHHIIPDVMTVADLTIDPARQKVLRGDTEVYLTRKEFTLLAYLARNRESVVSRGMIMEHVWNMGADPFSNTIEAHIFNLRKKIGAGRPLIHTVPGRGYRLSDEASFADM